MELAVFPWRFVFKARESIVFPSSKAGNVLRGALGMLMRRVTCHPSCPGARHCDQRLTCPYARIFEPAAKENSGPSGLADLPRPFVLRAAHLDGVTLREGDRFFFDLHVFLRDNPPLGAITKTFEEVARVGLGATRGKANLHSVWQMNQDKMAHTELGSITVAPPPLLLPLDIETPPLQTLRIRFVTPTELKRGGELAPTPDFVTVFGRARDRVATLSALYGAGPLSLSFRALGDHAKTIRMSRCDLRRVEVARRSSRTGQRHPLGGYIGEAEYQGELGEFIPILRAAEWTGIGRQTVWGKGEIRCLPVVS